MKPVVIQPVGEIACTHLAIVAQQCDAVSLELQAAARSAHWESAAADHFMARIWDCVGEVAAVGDLAMQVSYAVHAQLEEGGAP